MNWVYKTLPWSNRDDAAGKNHQDKCTTITGRRVYNTSHFFQLCRKKEEEEEEEEGWFASLHRDGLYGFLLTDSTRQSILQLLVATKY
jgi:hypothetical protein